MEINKSDALTIVYSKDQEQFEHTCSVEEWLNKRKSEDFESIRYCPVVRAKIGDVELANSTFMKQAGIAALFPPLHKLLKRVEEETEHSYEEEEHEEER